MKATLGVAFSLSMSLALGGTAVFAQVPQSTCWWKLDEGVGQVVSDSAGGFDGVLGTTTDPEPEDPQWFYAGGDREYVLIFNNGQQVLVPDAPGLNFDPSDEFTIALWILKPPGGSAGTLLGKRDGCADGPMNYQLVDEDVGQNSFHFNSQAGGLVPSGRTLPQSSWSHIAATYLPGGDLVLYINGREVGRGVNYSLGWSNVVPLLLGTAGTCYGFGGSMDDIRLWRQTLSEEEIQELSGFLLWDDFETGDTSAWNSTVP